MELPFAVESTDDSAVQGSALNQSDSSLVTASSQGSFMDSSQLDSPLPPNTPQDVVLPRYENRQQQTETTHHNTQTSHHHPPHPPPMISGPISSQSELDEPEIIDFTYVNVSEDDADDVGILLEGGDLDMQPETQRGDILTVLLSGMQQDGNEAILTRTENANVAATKATQAKKSGDLMAALEYHSQAAKLYRDNAMAIRDQNASLANSLLLLSQTQAKSALSLKGIVKLSAAELQQIFPSSDSDSKSSTTTSTSATMTQKDRLRAAVRGALGSRHPHEEDISDSQFLGRATSDPPQSTSKSQNASSPSPTRTGDDQTSDDEKGTLLWEGQDYNHNAVDEMMELERELRDMDMALELGNSISSLDARTQNRMKNSIVDGSFMVVPPGSNSYMSSSMWGNNPVPTSSRPVPHPPSNNTAGVRARANRVQTMLEASAAPVNRQAYLPQVAPAPSKNSSGLESSWWGNTSTTSQVLTSSVISLGSRAGDGNLGDLHGGHPANTKQLMRLMDSLKTLGDENAVLLREVEEAEAARLEAKAAREEMKKFREEYTNRLSKLKAALKKYAQEYPQGNGAGDHPVQTSEFHKSASTADQLQRQEQLIRKLTADLKKEKEALKKEKEESRKKDQALRKYENFYREVKARSAQKAAQKTQQQRQHKSPRKPTVGPQR